MATLDTTIDFPISGTGVLDRERIVAEPGFNRWMVPPAALCIHLCIGMAYGFSRAPRPAGASCFASWTLALPGDSKPSCVTQIMPGAGDNPKLLACATAIRKDVIFVVMGISR